MALWKAGGEVQIKSWNLDHGIVEGKGGGSWNKELEFRSWHCGRQEGGEGRGGERGTEAPLRYLKGASKASKVS